MLIHVAFVCFAFAAGCKTLDDLRVVVYSGVEGLDDAQYHRHKEPSIKNNSRSEMVHTIAARNHDEQQYSFI